MQNKHLSGVKCEGNVHGNELDETWNVRHWLWKQVTKADFKSFWQISLCGTLYEILSSKTGKIHIEFHYGNNIWSLPFTCLSVPRLHLNISEFFWLTPRTHCARIVGNWLCIALKRDRISYILYDLFAIDLVSLFANLLDIACVLGTACKCKCKCFRLAS